jgi:hypothetical protein
MQRIHDQLQPRVAAKILWLGHAQTRHRHRINRDRAFAADDAVTVGKADKMDAAAGPARRNHDPRHEAGQGGNRARLCCPSRLFNALSRGKNATVSGIRRAMKPN